VQEGGGDAGVGIGGGPGEADLLRGPGGTGVPRPAEDRFSRCAEAFPRCTVEFRGLRVADERGRDALRRVVEPPAVLLRLGERVGGEPAQHELEVARVERHPQLGLRGQAQDVARVLLGPALQHGAVGGDGGQVPVLGKDPGKQPLIEAVVELVLGLHGPRERLGEAGLADLPGDDEIVLQQHVALGLLRVGAEAELLDLLDEQAGDPQDVDVEDGVLGDRAVPHVEDDGLVGAPRLFHFPAGGGAQLVDGRRVAADARVGRGDRLGREVLRPGVRGLEFADGFVIEIEAGEDDVQAVPSFPSGLVWAIL